MSDRWFDLAIFDVHHGQAADGVEFSETGFVTRLGHVRGIWTSYETKDQLISHLGDSKSTTASPSWTNVSSATTPSTWSEADSATTPTWSKATSSTNPWS
jgi:hypothetical protein